MQNSPKNEIFRIAGLELQEELGRGAFSIIYAAIKGDQRFAVKLPLNWSDDLLVDAAERFYREGVEIARLRHVNLISVYDIGTSKDLPYLVMELVSTPPLSASLENGSTLPESSVLTLAKSIASALKEVHRKGLIHRDIKPENILYAPGSVAKLIDFGFVTKSSGIDISEPASAVEFAGSAAYSPPEQTGMVNRPVDARSDLYSLGAVMFHCLAGSPPFAGSDVAEVIRHHAVTTPPDLDTLTPNVSKPMAALIARLLKKDPDDRYQSAALLLLDLERLDSNKAPVYESQDAMLLSHLTSHGARFVGRQAELTKLDNAWSQARKKRGAVTLITGDIGSGKSRLALEWLNRLNLRDSTTGFKRVLYGSCARPPAAPFNPIKAAIQRYFSALTEESIATRDRLLASLYEVMGERLTSLHFLSPALSPHVSQDTRDASNDPSSHDTTFNSIAELLLLLAAKAEGLVLFIDNFQWLDTASREVLVRLASRLKNSHLTIVAAGRNDRDSQNSVVEIEQAFFPLEVTRLPLQMLPLEDCKSLISDLLGDHQTDEALLHAVAHRCRGNPLALHEFIKSMIDAHALTFSWGKWHAKLEDLALIDLSGDVLSLLGRRLNEISAEAKRLLVTAAVQIREFRPEILAQICQVGPKEALKYCDDAAKAGVIDLTPSGYVFVHDRIRDLLLSEVSPDELRNIHQATADVLATTPADTDDYLYAFATHLSQGRANASRDDSRKTYLATLRAGVRALASYGDDMAAKFFEAALAAASHASIQPEAQIYLGLGEVAVRRKDIFGGIVHYKAALAAVSDSCLKARIHVLLGRAYLAILDIPSAKNEVFSGFVSIGRATPRSPALRLGLALRRCLFGLLVMKTGIGFGKAHGLQRQTLQAETQLNLLLALIAYFDIDSVAYLEAVLSAPKAVSLLGITPELIRCYSGTASAMAIFGFKKIAAKLVRRSVEYSEHIHDRAALAEAKLLEAFTADFAGDALGAANLLKECLRDHSSWLDASNHISAGFALSWNLYLRGHLRNALANIEELNAQLKHKETPTSATSTTPFEAMALASMGRVGEATERSKAIEAMANEARKVPYLVTMFSAYQVFQNVAAGDLGPSSDPAVGIFHEMIGPVLKTSAPQARYFCIAEAYLRIGQCIADPTRKNHDYRRKLHSAVSNLKLSVKWPIFRGHYLVALATLKWQHGDHQAALEALSKADIVANSLDAPLISLQAARIRAHIYQQTGPTEVSHREAERAMALALTHEWISLSRQLSTEFSLLKSTSDTSSLQSRRSSTTRHTGDLKLKRHLESIINVSLAASTVLDPEKQGQAALDEVIKILNAERGFLFLTNETTLEPQLKSGRTNDGKDLLVFEGSMTVIERVRSTLEPIVRSGSDSGAALSSHSIVARDLRSIITVPIMLREKLIGIVYLDNRLSKGVFTEDDLNILLVIVNHIGVAIESSRAAKIELERRELIKDLEVTGAVQTLLMPKKNSFENQHFRLVGSCQPATHSGGDWWWYEVDDAGDLLILMGDVTGHGPGAAMVTSAVSASFHSLKVLSKQINVAIDPCQILDHLGITPNLNGHIEVC